MKIYLYGFLLSGYLFGQSEEIIEEKDSTFIIFKSGDTVHVNRISANIGYQNMINFNLDFFDSDSVGYDISEVDKVINSQGEVISKNLLFLIQFIRGCFNLITNFYLLYLIFT